MPSVKRVLADLSVFGKGFVRSRVGLFFAIIFPVVLILLFGSIFSGGLSVPISVYIQNQDGAQVSSAFVAALNSTAAIKLVPVATNQNFYSFLLSHSASDGVVIPRGFSAAFEAGRRVNVTVYGNPASATSATVSGITNYVVNAFNLKRAGGSSIIGITALTVASQSFKYVDFLVPGLVGFSVLTSPMFALVNVSSTYKRDKIFKQLSLTPLTRTEWLLSKIIWYIFLTFISFALMSLTGIYLFGAHIALTWEILPFLLVGPFLFVSLGMLVGTISNTPESAAIVGNLITFPMMFLAGTFFPVASMPPYLQGIAHLLPLYYLIDGLNNVMIYGNYIAAYFDAVVLLVISIAFFGLAVNFFKWRED